MSNNFSLLPLTAALLIASGVAAGYTGYRFIKDSAQDTYLIAQAYEAQTKGMQAIYLAERAATDSSYAVEFESLDTAVEKAITAIRNGDRIRGIAPAPDSVQRTLDGVQKAWDDIAPSISQISSKRGVTDQFTRSLGETDAAAKDALSAGKGALAELSNTAVSSAIKAQVSKAISILEDGAAAISSSPIASTDSLRASQASLGEFVSIIATTGPSIPRDSSAFAQLSKSYASAVTAQRLIDKTIRSSGGALENIPHAKTIWAARDRVASTTSALVSSIQVLPESRPFGVTLVAMLGGLTLLLSLGGMLLMRLITASQAIRVQDQGKTLERSTQTKSREYQQLLSEIQQVGQGNLKTVISEDNDTTREIAKLLNVTFGKVNSILDEVKQTIIGLSAAAEQTLIMDQNVAENRGFQNKAISHIGALFANLLNFIDQIEGMTTNTQLTSSEVLVRVREGAEAVTLVHENIVGLQQQTLDIQHRSKHLIESFQALERISGVVSEVSAKSQLVAYNADLIASRVIDKEVSGSISASASSMQRLASEAKQAVLEINILLQQMNEAARGTQTAVDMVQREGESLRKRSQVAQDALGDIHQMTTRLSLGVTQVKDQTRTLQAQSGEVTETMNAIQHYSTENSEASEQTAAAIGNVNRQAQGLQSTIGHFVLQD